MKLKDLWLFLVVCVVDGLCIFVGSIIGNSVGKAGLFTAAIAGGIVGVVAALGLAVRLGLIERGAFSNAFFGGVLGFFIAAGIAVKNLDGPIIPVLSIGLVGAGVLLASHAPRKAAN